MTSVHNTDIWKYDYPRIILEEKNEYYCRLACRQEPGCLNDAVSSPIKHDYWACRSDLRTDKSTIAATRAEIISKPETEPKAGCITIQITAKYKNVAETAINKSIEVKTLQTDLSKKLIKPFLVLDLLRQIFL